MKKTTIASIISLCLVPNAFAVEDGTTIEKAKNQPEVERIIISGTSRGRIMSDTPQSVSAIGEFELGKLTSSSQADVLRYIPGIKVEGGGGEVATNLQVRGLPSSGQFQFTPLMYDGSPSFSTFGLNSSAFDVYYRNDLGIERVEFVRGGVSNLFGAGSVAGVINYISKVGGDVAQSSVQLEMADQGRTRLDFATSGPLNNEGLSYALSGFYRYDDGPLDTGLPTKGTQLRGNIHKAFTDGSGSFTIYGQYIDDQAQFYLPIPLDGQNLSRLIGNDGKEVESLQTAYASSMSYMTADGRYESPISEGAVTKGSSVSFAFDKELTQDLAFNMRGKYAKYQHQFNLFLDGDGIVNVPETQSQFLANRGLGLPANASFTFVDSGQVLPADYLLFANRILDRNRPAEDLSTELNLVKSLFIGDFSHNITLGSFFSHSEADDDSVITTYLGEFNNVPRLVDVRYTDVDGSQSGSAGTLMSYTQNGVSGPGISYTNQTINATRRAVYIADQMESDKWILDLGIRWETIDGTINREGSQVVQLSDNPLLAPNLRVNTTGNGKITYGEVSTSDFAVSAAALYRLTDQLNVYANASRGFFFPEIRGIQFSSLGKPAKYEGEVIEQAELGIKFFNNDFNGSVALFRTDLKDRRSVDFVNDGQGGVLELPVLQSTKATGVELTGRYKLTDSWSVDANLTYTDHEFTQYDSDPTIIGNELRRKPKLMLNTAVSYQADNWDASFYHSYTGDNYANDANSVQLDAFHLFRVDVGHSWALSNDQKIRLSVGVFNLFDSDGVTEGSPRLGNNQSSDNPFFVGRPILPRRVTLRLKYDF
ncbi:MAG: TonB-dependent receptor [Paraglaciecola sp.]|nr:TonB-dependent receptor [Paraglaciecola sp.]